MAYTHYERTRRYLDRKSGKLPPFKRYDPSSSRSRRYFYKKRYGITVDDYDRMLNEQNGKCAICGKPPTNKRGLTVDHNHVTRKVRALLCYSCNLGLGLFKENPVLFKRAVEYLNKHNNK